MVDRDLRERKLLALMVNDLEAASLGGQEMEQVVEEVGALSDEELDRTLTDRLDLPHPVDDEVLERALGRIEEPETLTEDVGRAPNLSHEARPEEREA